VKYAMTSTDVAIDRNKIECQTCMHPAAADVRHFMANATDGDIARQMSPRGRPLGCCKIASTPILAPHDQDQRARSWR
jgi:hypothetical protein